VHWQIDKGEFMRIVAEKNKGNILKSPKDLSVRPTSEKGGLKKQSLSKKS